MKWQNDGSSRVQELLQELVRVCKKGREGAAVTNEQLIITESGDFLPSLKQASAQTVPKMQLLQEQRVLLAGSPHPQKLMEKIEQLKDEEVQGIDRYIWLVGQIIADPEVQKLVSNPPDTEPSASLDSTPAAHKGVPRTTNRPAEESAPTESSHHGNARHPLRTSTKLRGEKKHGVPMALVEGVSYPGTPQWNLDRPYLTGKHLYEQNITILAPVLNSSRRESLEQELIISAANHHSLGAYSPSVQELLVVNDLLFMMVGLEGNYIRIKRGRLKENSFMLLIDPSMDSSVQELAKRFLPLCENYLAVSQFSESRWHFKHGLVSHACASALRTILQDYHAMVAQLEHQFRLTRLSLEGLWFFCQPVIGTMQTLATVVQKAGAKNVSGASILNLLQTEATAIGGDSSARALLQKLTKAASAPYFRILERWLSEGVIDDPYGEFLIEENKTLQKESLSQDYHATYWHQRYSLREDIPGFLSGFAQNILTTGKYLNAVRECGGSIKVPFSNAATAVDLGTRRPYLEHINVAYNHASAELINLIVSKFDLIGRLRSLKHYFFMDQGDFYVHFMDIAKDELQKRSSVITMTKLQSLLELALRTSVSASDPYYDDVLCDVEKSTLLTQLQNAITSGMINTGTTGSSEPFVVNLGSNGSANGNQGSTVNITGIDTFTLDYKVRWPLTLVISRKCLMKYQLIFRHLFHFKHVERQLCMTWQAHQATRHLSFVGAAITQSYVLCQRMLHFLQSSEHYMTFEVLEPNWHVMEMKIRTAKSVDEIIQQHEMFLDKCLRECMLLWPSILQKVESLKTICQQYATTTQWLIPSMNTPVTDEFSEELVVRSAPSRTGKSRQHSKSRPAKTWEPEAESNFRSTLANIDGDFKTHLKELISLLSTNSQREPCFAHFAQALQGDEQAKHSYND